MLIQNNLLAWEGNQHSLKARASLKDGIVKVKVMLVNPIIELEKANVQKSEELKKDRVGTNGTNLISHLSAKLDNKIVFDMSVNPLYITSIIRHKFKYITKKDNLKYIITDNQDNEKEFDVKIKRNNKQPIQLNKFIDLNNSVINFRKTKPNLWRANNIQQAIRELYGSNIDITEEKINLITPKQVTCNLQIPISISSDMDLESLAIFVDTLPGITLAVFSFSKLSIIDYKLYLSLNASKAIKREKV